MYNLLLRYVYVLVAAALLVLLPRIALPDRDTRAALFDVAVRARTVRVDAFDVAVRAAVPRDVTPRDAVDALFVVARDAAAGRVDTPREIVAFDVVPRAVDILREDCVRPDARGDVAFARGDCAAGTFGTAVGATGSAKTARIDKNVEHTKNAPASKNTVPTAFFP